MKLFLDVGNTRLKWLLLAGNSTKKILSARKGSVSVIDFSRPNNTVKENIFFKQIKSNIYEINSELGNKLTLKNKCLTKIVWICVAPKLTEKKIVNVLNKLFGKSIPKKVATPQDGKFNFEMDWGEVCLKCNYEHPSKLGADRWAASVGLAFLGPPSRRSIKYSNEIILVSAGTATVIDKFFWSKISEKKWVCELKGGIILPGFGQMSSIMKFLDKSIDQKKTNLTLYPTNTTDAIKTGIAFSQALCEKNKNKIIVVHGGDSGKWVDSYVFFNPSNIEPIRLPWLVFEGLFLINKSK